MLKLSNLVSLDAVLSYINFNDAFKKALEVTVKDDKLVKFWRSIPPLLLSDSHDWVEIPSEHYFHKNFPELMLGVYRSKATGTHWPLVTNIDRNGYDIGVSFCSPIFMKATDCLYITQRFDVHLNLEDKSEYGNFEWIKVNE